MSAWDAKNLFVSAIISCYRTRKLGLITMQSLLPLSLPRTSHASCGLLNRSYVLALQALFQAQRDVSAAQLQAAQARQQEAVRAEGELRGEKGDIASRAGPWKWKCRS